MDAEQNYPKKTGMSVMTDAEFCEGDRSFLRSLDEFIQEQKNYLQCPEEGADELRYIIYRSAFNKLIGRASAYRRILLAIKAEYDDVIREMKRREEEAAADAATRLEALLRRAAVLTDRTSVLQNQTAELQEEVRRQSSTAQSRLVPGLTVAQSEDPEVLQAHLEHLQTQREVLLAQRSRCVPVEVQTRMTFHLQGAEHHRDQLREQNQQLATRFRRLKLVSERLENWEESGRTVPLEDLLGSTVQNLEAIRTERLQEEENDEGSSWIHPELLEEELDDHLERFLDLFGSGQYRAAALLAARPPGVLRNSDTMQMFSGVRAPPGSAPPALLFFQALLVTVAAGSRLPGRLSLQGVGCTLRHGDLQLVVHAVTQDKLTFTEELGDALTEHAQKKPGVADLCLALASTVYQACRKHQKTALSMLRRGLVHGAAEVMKQQVLTTEEILWVLSCSPSLSLLQLLTDSQAAILSVGGACASMLADPQQRQVALQLLDGLLGRGGDVLQDAILEDSRSTVDVWDQVASLCSQLQRDDLSRAVRSVLLDQNGTGLRSPDLEGGRLMEHVFL